MLLRKDGGQSNNKRLITFKEEHNTLSEEAKEFLLKININNESILKDQEDFSTIKILFPFFQANYQT